MALDRFPRAAGGDAHLLVVVALAAAGSESIAQPEAARNRKRIGDIGEGRRAFVGGDHQIGIVAVAAQHMRGRRRSRPGRYCR